MSGGVDAVVVRVSDKILWVGSDAYPVSNIGHIGCGKWMPNHGAIWGKFVRSIIIVLFLAFVFNMVANFIPWVLNAASVWVIAAIVFLGFFLQAAVASSRPVRFLLSVESGNSRSTIASVDPALVQQLAVQLTTVINQPHAEFSQVVRNVQYGDNITQIGNDNLGKILR